jgi:hypothetical protein
VRLHLLQALSRPLEDVRFAGQKLECFYQPVAFVRSVEAHADRAERALEVLSLGLGVVEIVLRAEEDDDNGAEEDVA